MATLRRSFPDSRPFAATEAKEALGTTRRTAIPLLEHLDRTGVTVRQGDLRRLAEPGQGGPAGRSVTRRPGRRGGSSLLQSSRSRA